MTQSDGQVFPKINGAKMSLMQPLTQLVAPVDVSCLLCCLHPVLTWQDELEGFFLCSKD